MPDGCTHVFHKYRVRLDPAAAGIALPPRALRDHVLEALRAEDVEAERLLRSAAGAIRQEAEEAQVDVGVDIGGSAGRVVRCDPVRMEAALIHLLRNAVQAAGSGGTVRARLEAADEWVRFIVDDDGPGVPREVRERLFDPFFTTKPVGSGSGLGLAVVHGVADEHSGTAAIAAAPMGGARFLLTIPNGEGDG